MTNVQRMPNVQCPMSKLGTGSNDWFGGSLGRGPWSFIGRWSLVIGEWASLVPKILELQGDRKVLGADGGDDRLQVIPVFARHADFISLDLRGEFQFEIADEGGDLFGQGRFDALFDLNHLAGVAE